MEIQPILHVWVHPDNDLIDLTIATPTKGQHGASSKSKSEVVHTNQKHPFLTTEYGFVPVGQIKVGMHVVGADGSIGVISRWTIVPGVKMMYNLEVAQDHTFTVGDGQWVVHNCSNPVEGFGKLTDLAINVSKKGLQIVEDHLSQFLDDSGNIAAENKAMIERLQSALEDGRKIVGADSSFYMHELYESTLMESGMAYQDAHLAAFYRYGVSPYSVYHPEVIQNFPQLFNEGWFQFWQLPF